ATPSSADNDIGESLFRYTTGTTYPIWSISLTCPLRCPKSTNTNRQKAVNRPLQGRVIGNTGPVTGRPIPSNTPPCPAGQAPAGTGTDIWIRITTKRFAVRKLSRTG